MTADMSASQTLATSSISAASLMSALKRIGWASEVSEMVGCRGLAMGQLIRVAGDGRYLIAVFIEATPVEPVHGVGFGGLGELQSDVEGRPPCPVQDHGNEGRVHAGYLGQMFLVTPSHVHGGTNNDNW